MRTEPVLESKRLSFTWLSRSWNAELVLCSLCMRTEPVLESYRLELQVVVTIVECRTGRICAVCACIIMRTEPVLESKRLSLIRLE